MARGTKDLLIYGVVGYALWKSGILNQVLAKLPSGIGSVGAAPIGPGGGGGSSGGSVFDNQMRQWQTERQRNGENPHDWQAFRTHQIAIGAGDPGPTPVAGFSSGGGGGGGGFYFTP